MYGKPLKVDNEGSHGERDAGPPEDVAGDDGPEGVIRIRKHFSNDAARSGGDNGGDDGQEPDGCHGGEGRNVVDVHSAPSLDIALNGREMGWKSLN